MSEKKDEKRENGISITIDKNFGTTNVSEGDIYSNNIVNLDKDVDKNEILDITTKIIKLLNEEKFDNDEKESIIDDLQTIQEQVKEVEPKKVKIKKAYNNIKDFVLKIPATLTQATLITEALNKLMQELGKLNF